MQATGCTEGGLIRKFKETQIKQGYFRIILTF